MSENNEHVIKKRTIHAGTKAVEFTPNSKVHFHFQTRLCDENKTIIDDSRQMGTGKPIELVLGKKFKLEVWENLIQKLSLNEVASFIVDKSLIESYPFVAKTLRDVHMPIEKRKMTHCCAISIQTEGLGYDDLNKLVKNPQNLEFIFDLIKVEQPDDYKKEIWQMDDNEKLKQIPELKQKGNEHYKNKNLKEASEFYSTAIALLEQLMIREKPQEDDWNKLNKQKLPLLLNFAQCKLAEGDYYSAIEHCNTVIKSDQDNVKAYYRRAKAHAGVWNTKEAIKDFNRVSELDPTLRSIILKQLSTLNENIKLKDNEDKSKLQNLFK